MAKNYVIEYLPIDKAIERDDWEFVSGILDKDPELMNKGITAEWDTPLMLAVAYKSHRCVKQMVDRIVAMGNAEKLFVRSNTGGNALHYAAMYGNTTGAMTLVEHNPHMILVPDPCLETPLLTAAAFQNKDTLEYLLKVINTWDLEAGTNPFTAVDGGNLITLTIEAGFVDVALEIVDKHPDIVLEEDTNGQTALQVLATKPELFPSGSRLGYLGRLIYSSPPIKNIHDIKVQHIQSNLLVKFICMTVIDKVNYDIVWKILGSALSAAVTHGTHELAKECILTYPDIINYSDCELFLEVITQRQEQMYNLVCPTSFRKYILTNTTDNEKNENPLHKAAKLAPIHRLHAVTGAALQMQRELSWFKEIERSVNASQKRAKNIDKKTPSMIFAEEHKDLLKEGQQWMKDTSSSCSLVAALVVTIAFAAAFTIPGGNQDDGKPLFINKGSFMLFIVSDAIALFSSSTSVLMFLGILTSRYAEEDFLYSLPKRMTIGLVSLFLSLAATLIAFSATLALVLQDKVTWIAAPLVIITCIPVSLFGWLQFPLLVELIYSTYGPSIFHQQNDRD